MSKWEDNELQFARLISELDALGVFTEDVVEGLSESMDLEPIDLWVIKNRADTVFEKAKADIFNIDKEV